LSIEAFDTGEKITWCPGCTNYAVLNALKQAIQQIKLPVENVVTVSGIGCHGRITDYIQVNGFHVIHGRVLPTATGIKLANHELTVIGHAGDGDAFGIGLGHFAHAARRNVPITYITHNNLIYGLTAGQMSPTSIVGQKTKTSPHGVFEMPINPIAQALAANASFVARGFSGDLKQLVELFKKALIWKGFAIIDIIQPCITFDRVNTMEFYRNRVYRLEDSEYDFNNFNAACSRAWEWGDRIPTGIFYKVERPSYTEAFATLKKDPLIKKSFNVNISQLMKEFQ